MIILIMLSIVIGAVVTGISGFSVLGWAAGILFFILGLPGALLVSFVHGEVSYAQDRADYRQTKSDIAAWEIAEAHECAEDVRTDRLAETIERNPAMVYRDNREQHIHIHGRA